MTGMQCNVVAVPAFTPKAATINVNWVGLPSGPDALPGPMYHNQLPEVKSGLTPMHPYGPRRHWLLMSGPQPFTTSPVPILNPSPTHPTPSPVPIVWR